MVAVAYGDRSRHALAVDHRAVLAAEILEDRACVARNESRVTMRDRCVVQAHLRFGTTPDHVFALGELEALLTHDQPADDARALVGACERRVERASSHL